jgi:hypothetical protein
MALITNHCENEVFVSCSFQLVWSKETPDLAEIKAINRPIPKLAFHLFICLLFQDPEVLFAVSEEKT